MGFAKNEQEIKLSSLEAYVREYKELGSRKKGVDGSTISGEVHPQRRRKKLSKEKDLFWE